MADDMVVLFSSGKKQLFPLDEFPELLAADNDARRRYTIFNAGATVRWDELDFEIKIEELSSTSS